MSEEQTTKWPMEDPWKGNGRRRTVGGEKSKKMENVKTVRKKVKKKLTSDQRAARNPQPVRKRQR